MRLRIVGAAPQYLEHLDPIRYGALEAGWQVGTDDPDVTLVASTRDLPGVPGAVYMDHGCGLQWHPDYNLALIRRAAYVLAPNVFLRERYEAAGIRAEVIGTPKLDELLSVPYHADGPICISFHWASVLGSAILRDYRPELAALAARYYVIGHGHPRVWTQIRRYWMELGIEPVRTFAEVVERASVYVCDHSSTLYEWAALDRPVVLMDYPAQQTFPKVSSGLRYTEFADIGPHVLPKNLVKRIEEPDEYAGARRRATEALYPYLGAAVPRALSVLENQMAYSMEEP